MSFNVAMTLYRDILLFLVSKGEERAAEDQQRVISALENASHYAKTNYTSYMHV